MTVTSVLAVRVLVIGTVIIVAALHVIRADVSPIERGISRYASGSTLPWMTLAFLAFAAAIGMTAWMTRSWLLGIAAIAQAGVAAFPDGGVPSDRSVPHTFFGLVFFVTVATGLYASHRSSSWAWLPIVALLVFFASVAGVPFLARVPGLLQRVCFAAIAVSLLAVDAGA